MNIVYIGMPTSGKSTVALWTAQEMGLTYIDTDALVAVRSGMKSAQDVIRELGEDEFVRLEELTVMSLEGMENSSIATGGGTIYSERSMRLLKSLGKVIYLDVPFAKLQERLLQVPRVLLRQNGRLLREVYDERLSLYLKYADEILTDET